MKSYLAYLEQEFKVYEEILHGKLNPTIRLKEHDNNLTNLIELANTKEILVPHDELESLRKEITEKHQSLGYRSPDDLVIKVAVGHNALYNHIYIIPGTHYLIGNHFDDNIGTPENEKELVYLKLIIDEFERIKIRACARLHKSEDHKLNKKAIINNLNLLQNLLREVTAKHNFILHNQKSTTTEKYIFDCLKKFTIKTLWYYHTLYEPQIGKYKSQSLNLIKECQQISFPGVANYLVKKENEIEYHLVKEPDNHSEYRSIKFRWNGKLNHLATIFYDLYENGLISNNPCHDETKTNMDLVEFIHRNFLDNHGHPISKDTLRTYLNPNRHDKRYKY